MKVLITGGLGYIGSHLRYLLENKGHQVAVLDLKNGHDLRIKEHIVKLFELHLNFDAVVHLAAKISVPESEIMPAYYYDHNTTTIVKLMDVMNKFNCKNLVFSSTAAVYDFDEKNSNNLSETSPIHPHSIYGHSKLMAENILQRLSNKMGINHIIFRFFNVAGTNDAVKLPDRHPHLLPVLMDKYSEGEKISIFGRDYETPDGTCVRDYVHVDDICSAINMALVKLVNCEKYANIINLGTSSGYSVKEVFDVFNKTLDVSDIRHPSGITAEKIRHLDDVNIEKRLEFEYEPRRAGDPASLIADHSRATVELGWKPTYGLEEMISTTIKYW